MNEATRNLIEAYLKAQEDIPLGVTGPARDVIALLAAFHEVGTTTADLADPWRCPQHTIAPKCVVCGKTPMETAPFFMKPVIPTDMP